MSLSFSALPVNIPSPSISSTENQNISSQPSISSAVQPLQSFKEFKWLNSHSVATEVQCGLCRLELPIDMCVSSNEVPEEIYITTQILCNQIPVQGIPLSTNFATVDTFRNSLVWNYVLSFPVKIRDLSLDSILVITAWSPDGKPFGGTTMNFFDVNGVLKRGKQKLLFYFNRCADPNCIISENQTPGNLYDLYAPWDQAFSRERSLEAYKNSILIREQREHIVDMGFVTDNESLQKKYNCQWLDRLTFTQVHSTLSETMSRCSENVNNKSKTNNIINCNNGVLFRPPPEELDLQTYCCLVVEMPMLQYKILHDEKVYPTVFSHDHPSSLGAMTSGCGYVSEKGSSIIEFSLNLPNKHFNANSLCVVADWDIRQDNLYEYQYRCLAHDMLPRGTSDPNIKPNLQDKENLERIVQDARSHNLSSEDMDLLYKFRYTLTENKKALTKFLLSVIWTPSEVAELPLLLSKWQRIDVADALKLLGREKSFRRPLIREYAVNMLAIASDEELLTYLLQLVQALRYDDVDLNASNNIQPTDTNDDNTITNSTSNPALSPLATFLIQRGCNSLSVANYLYWYLKVETKPSMEDDVIINGEGDGCDSSMVMFQMILDKFVSKLQESPEGKKMCAQLQGLDEYMKNISDCQTIVRNVNSKQDAKQEQMCRLLNEKKLQNVPSIVTSVPYPLNPTIQITGLDPNSARIFASAVYPCRLTFHTQNNEINTDKKIENDSISLSELSIKDENTSKSRVIEESRVMIIFKSGDDLRQDQLIMQMTNLMDSLLKKVNLDLKMNMYGILAVSKDFGIMEFVQKSEPVSKVLKDHKSIGNFLRFHNPDETGPYEMSALVLDTFVKSCAACCVTTYILGIGDRHLDNIMLKPNGQLFHIDFGFIFDQDPKKIFATPPPFRFTRAMADAMGGEDSVHYSRFKAYCCQAYNWLRKSAHLILNLLNLMADAGIQDISKKATIDKVLELTTAKFRLDLTDEQAEQYFLALISESLNNVSSQLLEVAHRIAVSRR